LAIIREILADNCSGFEEDTNVENDANDSQKGIPDKNPMHLS
jgi:hypothetical protein